MDNCLEFLQWDSSHFGFNLARIKPELLNEDGWKEMKLWCKNNNICCLYLTIDISDRVSAVFAEKNRFKLVDIRMTFEKDIISYPHLKKEKEIRFSTDADIPVLRAIARSIYHDTRFYYDDKFPKKKVSNLYETWITKSLEGFADAVLIYHENRSVLGYITCHRKDCNIGTIGLVGVAEAAQGRKLGQKLVEAALSWFAERGQEKVTVVTQGRNLKAQRLYQKQGFITRTIELTFHKWF